MLARCIRAGLARQGRSECRPDVTGLSARQRCDGRRSAELAARFAVSPTRVPNEHDQKELQHVSNEETTEKTKAQAMAIRAAKKTAKKKKTAAKKGKKTAAKKTSRKTAAKSARKTATRKTGAKKAAGKKTAKKAAGKKTAKKAAGKKTAKKAARKSSPRKRKAAAAPASDMPSDSGDSMS
jgi:hypothetical protein